MEFTDGLTHPEDRFVDMPDTNPHFGVESVRVVIDAGLLDDLALADMHDDGFPVDGIDDLRKDIVDQLIQLVVRS